MKILSRSPHDSSFSFSRRFKKLNDDHSNDDDVVILKSSEHHDHDQLGSNQSAAAIVPRQHKKKSAVSKLRSAFSSHSSSSKLLVGTLYGYRRGHVNFAFQADPRFAPEFLIELEATTSVLVRDMASGVVRIALECDRKVLKVKKKSSPNNKLLDEPVWRAYCNGRKCGLGVRRDLGLEDSQVLRALEPVSMGAGVLPGRGGDGGETDDHGELMYMRARFERVVASRDSEAFYMINPDGSAGPELSVYLLRV